MISFGLGIGGGLVIGKSLGVDGPSQAAWIPASYSYACRYLFCRNMLIYRSPQHIDFRCLRHHDRPTWVHLWPQESLARRGSLVGRLVVHQCVLHQFRRLQCCKSLERYRRGDDCAQRHCNDWNDTSAWEDAESESGLFWRRGSGGWMAGGFVCWSFG